MTRSDVAELRRAAEAAAFEVGVVRAGGGDVAAATAAAGRAHVVAELAALALQGDAEAAALLDRFAVEATT